MRFLLLLLVLPLPLRADMYKWTDEKGVLHVGSAPPSKVSPKIKVKKIESAPVSVYEAVVSTGTDLKFLRGAPSAGVELFSTSWCPYCVKARQYLTDHGVAFQEFDIDKDPQAKQRYASLGGHGVPLAVINGQTVSGFSESTYNQLLTKKP